MKQQKLPKGIKEAVQRIIEMAKEKQKIIILGDADLDGIASVIILKELFELLNPFYSKQEAVEVFFPNREEDGHGLSEQALKKFKKQPPATLFVLDCGIGNYKEVEKAKKLGFEVIIIDHHPATGKLPKADILIDPKQKGDTCPFKEFAAAGLVYKVAESVLQSTNYPDFTKESLLELGALATLADMMVQEEDNQEIIETGLQALQRTRRPGLLSLIELQDADVQIEAEVFQKIIAPLNSGKLQDNISETYSLLVESSKKEAKKLAQKLIKQNREKKRLVELTVAEIGQKLNAQKKEESIIFEANNMWPAPFLAAAASRLLQAYKKPVFLLRIGEKISICSVRLPKGVNGVDALVYCKKYLEAYGGHPPACGCRLKNENIGEFKNCLEEYFKKNPPTQ